MFWRLDNLPELAHLSTAERSELLRKCTGRYFTIWLWMRSTFKCFAVLFLLLSATIVLVNAYEWDWLTARIVLPGMLMLWPMTTVAFYQFSLIRIRGQLRIDLERRMRSGEKLPVCIRCGYAISDRVERCPECGAAV